MVNASIVASFVICSSNGVGIISKFISEMIYTFDFLFWPTITLLPFSLKIIAMSLAAISSLCIYPHTSDWCCYVCADFCCQVVRMHQQENTLYQKFHNWMQLIGWYSGLHKDTIFTLRDHSEIVLHDKVTSFHCHAVTLHIGNQVASLRKWI